MTMMLNVIALLIVTFIAFSTQNSLVAHINCFIAGWLLQMLITDILEFLKGNDYGIF